MSRWQSKIQLLSARTAGERACRGPVISRSRGCAGAAGRSFRNRAKFFAGLVRDGECANPGGRENNICLGFRSHSSPRASSIRWRRHWLNPGPLHHLRPGEDRRERRQRRCARPQIVRNGCAFPTRVLRSIGRKSDPLSPGPAPRMKPPPPKPEARIAAGRRVAIRPGRCRA